MVLKPPEMFPGGVLTVSGNPKFPLLYSRKKYALNLGTYDRPWIETSLSELKLKDSTRAVSTRSF
jgi:hypothetical protein